VLNDAAVLSTRALVRRNFDPRAKEKHLSAIQSS